MKRNFRKTVFTLGLSALLTAAAGGVFALSQTSVSALAQENSSPSATAFVAPDSYEQYLSLAAPAGAAVCADYTAVADGNLIYIYDREEGAYKTYSHEENGLPQTVKNLQFCENGNLYFAGDASGDNFYELKLDDMEKRKISDIACEKFVIDGTELYFASAAGTLYTLSLSLGGAPTPLLPQEYPNPNEPILAFWNGELYFTDNGMTQRLYKVSPATRIPTPVTDLAVRIQYMTINAGILAYTTSAGDFYAYTLPTVNDASLVTHIPSGDFTTLYSFGEHIYVTQKARGAVKQYSIARKAFTDYEIASSSSSLNRLSGASELCLQGEVLYIADDGNDRISRYHVETGEFADPIPLSFKPSYLSTDGETLLAANGEQAALYDLTSTPAPLLLQTLDGFNGEIKGVATVYGTHYLISSGYAYAVQKNAESGEWSLSKTPKGCASFVSPELFASDIYGDLYVATGSFVYRFAEEDFMQAEKEGKEICSKLPASASKLALDYDRALYALADNLVYRFDDAQTSFDFSTPQVYASSVSLTSFALSAEENATYLLCDGNYVLQTDELKLPTVKSIPVNGADEEIFSENSAEIVVLKTAKNALVVRFDIEKLQGAAAFPYLSYARQQSELTALKLGQAGDYAIVAVFHEDEHAYSTYVVKNEFCTLLSQNEYQTIYGQSEQRTGYLTNGIHLYKFPYLNELLIAGELPRGGQVQVLGEIGKLDHEYYLVSYQTESGAVKTGYVPKAYITPFDGTPPTAETVVRGETESDHDMLWRLGYILLGLAAIGILTDWLILRKKED